MIRFALPPGSSREQVETWLQKQKIEFVFQQDVKADRINDKTIPEIAGLNSCELCGMIRGTIRDAHVDLILPGDIEIYFFFDSNGKMIKHLVYPWVYFL